MQPMLATLADAPLRDPNLVYEPKYDGIRALVTVAPGARGTTVGIASRLGNDKTAQFPEVTAAFQGWGRRRKAAVVFDGEIVALDPQGEPVGFENLQPRIHLGSARDVARVAAERPVAFVAFDLLREGGDDLCGLALAERRRRLEAALAGVGDGGTLRISRQERDGAALMDEARARGWEGIIAKDARSIYRPGRRTQEWRKLKLVQEEDLIVGGYTEPRGARSGFGALLLGLPTGDGRLRYAGHVGGGFSDKELARVGRLLEVRATKSSPFVSAPPANEKPHWVRPELIARVKFAEWTSEGFLRQPIYLGLRDDISPADVIAAPPIGGKAAPSPPIIASTPTTIAPVPPGEDERRRLIEAIDALEARGSGRLTLPDGTVLDLGNVGKKLWPELGLSKGDLLRYYVEVSPYLLPVVRDRPLVMRRFPNGIAHPAFYQHRAPEQVPAGVRAERIDPDDDVPSRFVGGDLATLLHMAQLAVISQDPWFSRAQSPRQMDFAAIDLDPMDQAPFSRVRDVARWVHDELEALALPSFLKTSGSSGLHIYLPLPPGTPFEAGMLFCQIIASIVAGQHPEAATVERTVKKRDPKTIYIDYLQNVEGKTLACAYSARASDYAGASTPLAWHELDDRLDPRAFTIQTLPARLAQVGDLWAPLLQSPGIDLEAALERVGARHG